MGEKQRAKVASSSRRLERVSHQPTSTRCVTLLVLIKRVRFKIGVDILISAFVKINRKLSEILRDRCDRCPRGTFSIDIQIADNVVFESRHASGFLYIRGAYGE